MAGPLFDLDPLEPTPSEVARDKPRFRRAAFTALLAVAVLWWIALCEYWFGWDLGGLGVRPREAYGLIGVLTAPFVHANFDHLMANTLPLLMLGTLALYHYPLAFKRALPLIWLVSGLGVWLWARPSTHLGASGIAHGLMFFIFVLGILRRDRQAIALSLLVFFLYGGMLMTSLPREAQISWEYHLFGTLSGIVSAVLWRKLDPARPRKKYSWDLEAEQGLGSDDEFDLPRPGDVPVLWRRPEQDDEPRVLQFPGARARRDGDEPPPTLH
jgi:membrane associated rhomboid family serine protease